MPELATQQPDHSAAWNWARVALVAAVLLVYSRLFSAEFTSWDDPHTVAANPAMLPPTWAGVLDYWRLFEPAGSGNDHPINHRFGLWIPLTYTVWSGIAAASQVTSPMLVERELNPYVFHAANIAVHALTSLCVLAVLQRLFGRERVFPAAAGAMVFALHPIQVEAVAWVSGLKDLLAGLFGCAMILAYLVHTDEAGPMPHRRAAWWASAALLVLALLCKPSAVMMPALAGAIDWLLIRRRLRDVLLSTAPLLLIALPVAVIARLAQNDVELTPTPGWARPLVVLDAIGFYLGKVAVPVSHAIDYGRTPARVLGDQTFWLSGAIAIAALMTALAAARRGRTAGLTALAVFVLAPLPTLGFVPFLFQNYSTTADHYLYVAMLGPAIAFAALLGYFPSKAASVAAGVALFVLALLSFRQTAVWRDSLALFTQAVRVNPTSYPARSTLAKMRPPNDPSLEAEFESIVALHPRFVAPLIDLRIVQTELSKPIGALRTLQREVKLKRTLPYAAARNWRNDPAIWAELLLTHGHAELALREAERLASERPDEPNRQRLARLARMIVETEARSGGPSTVPAQ